MNSINFIVKTKISSQLTFITFGTLEIFLQAVVAFHMVVISGLILEMLSAVLAVGTMQIEMGIITTNPHLFELRRKLTYIFDNGSS